MFKNTNERPTMNKRDNQVELRNDILSNIDYGCTKLNTKGDRHDLAHCLKYLHNNFKHGFTVNPKSSYVLNAFGDSYTKNDGMIVVEEDGKELIAIVQLKSGQCKGEWRAYEINHHEFRYDADLKAEAQWEQDAEQAMSDHYEGRNGHWNDDPRGY